MVAGTFNKYRGLIRLSHGLPDPAPSLFSWIEHPSLTAIILMIAAAVNCVISAYHLILGGTDPWLFYMMATLAWGIGVLGDNALRMNDQSNFAVPATHHYAPTLMGLFLYAARNPCFYYLFCNIFMASATLARSSDAGGEAAAWMNGIVIAVSGAGILYGLYKTHRVNAGLDDARTLNDGIINYAGSIGCVAIAALAVMTGNYWVLCAQILFTFSNLKALFETRSALRREGSIPAATP